MGQGQYPEIYSIFPSEVPSACLFYSPPLAAIIPAHLASTETTALPPANAQRGSATLCLGPASWVSGGRMREHLVLSIVFMSLICKEGWAHFKNGILKVPEHVTISHVPRPTW